MHEVSDKLQSAIRDHGFGKAIVSGPPDKVDNLQGSFLITSNSLLTIHNCSD
jgi:hypothetical protein